jgi:hypothetical protein
LKTTLARLSRPAWALLTLAAALAPAAALATNKTDAAAALSVYQQERGVCMSGQSNQDRSTCLREAGAAFAEAQRRGPDDASTDYARNALKRCERLPDADRQACVARMTGQGTTSGSVAAGGIYRELVTREPASPSPAKPVSDASGVPVK